MQPVNPELLHGTKLKGESIMAGPIAPKDPQEKRPGFYVLLDKPVGGIPQDDGKGKHSVFINRERLPSFAKVTGGITDEKILALLTTASGFRELVHSIGVSLTASDPKLTADFSLMFRGVGGEGSNHHFRIPCDGTENTICLDELTWSRYDAEPAELRFEFPASSDTASASVKFYVNDGFDVPPSVPEPEPDFGSTGYRELIARSFLSAGNNAAVQRFLRRAKAGEEVSVAFLGGSITQGAGAVPLQENCYPFLTVQGLRERYGEKIRYLKAGVGGTPSETGLMRYERDITRNGTVQPDLVVLEFAVNDAGDETEGIFYESLVRKILRAPNQPAVILLFAVFSDDWNLKQRLAPIGYRYQLPMADILEAVVPQFYDADKRVITKRQYFYDVFHPANAGHRIMADSLLYLIERLEQQQPDLPPAGTVPPVYGDDFEDLQFFDRSSCPEDVTVIPGSFTAKDMNLQCVPLDADAYNTPMFPHNWKKEPGDAAFTLEITCRRLVLEFKDSGSTAFGKALVTVDGEKQRLLDPQEAGWTHCHSAVLFNRRESAPHKVEISVLPEDADKTFTILGFGYVP